MEVTALDISPTEAGETKTGNAGPEVGSAVYTRGDEAHAITKTYNLKTACASEQNAINNRGTIKRISWRRPGRYFLRTNKPELLSFCGTGEQGNLLELASGFKDEKTHMRLCFAPIQSFIRAQILVFVHSGVPPERPAGLTENAVWTPKFYTPVETLLFNVSYTAPECLRRPSISWKRLVDATKFSNPQLKVMYEQFWHDTIQAGNPGILERCSFRPFLANLGLKGLEDGDADVDRLWAWFDREENNVLDFEAFILGLGKTWQDVQFFGLSTHARKALETEAKYSEIDEQDKAAKHKAVLDAQLEDVNTAYTRLTGSPIPGSPISSRNSSNQNQTPEKNHSQVSQVKVKRVAFSPSTKSPGGTTPFTRSFVSISATNDSLVDAAQNKDSSTATSKGLLKTPPNIQRHASFSPIHEGKIDQTTENKTENVIEELDIQVSDDSNEAVNMKTPEAKSQVENVSSVRSMTEEELASRLQDAFDQVISAGGLKSPDTSLQNHPLARSFVRACGTSPMDDDVLNSLASAFANELVESSMFVGEDGAPTSPVVPVLDLTSAINSDEDASKENFSDGDGSSSSAIDGEDPEDHKGMYFSKIMKAGNVDDSNISMDDLMKKAENSKVDALFNWEVELQITVHGASELAIMPDDHPFVEVTFVDLPNMLGAAHIHTESNFKTLPAADAIDVKWPESTSTFVANHFFQIDGLKINEKPSDSNDGLPMYGAANILFTVRRGVKEGKVGADMIGKTSLSVAPLHAKVCNVSENSEEAEHHGIQKTSLSLRAKGHSGLGSGDLGNLEVSAVLVYRRVEVMTAGEAEQGEIKKSTRLNRQGVRDNFGDEDFRQAAQKLRVARRKSGVKLLELFHTLSGGGASGFIEREQCSQALITLGADISIEEARLVFDHFDREMDGKLSYEEYVEMMMSGGKLSPKEQQEMAKDKQRKKEEKEKMDKDLLRRTNLDAVVWRVRDERKRRQITPQTLFDMFDDDNNGSLTKDELKEAFDRWSFKYTEDDIDAIYIEYADEDSLMDYRDFLRFLMGGKSESGKRVDQSGGAGIYDLVYSEDESDVHVYDENASSGGEGNKEPKEVSAKERARKAFTRQRSIGFADPAKSYLAVTVYSAEGLLKGKNDKMPKAQVHMKTKKNGKRYRTKLLKQATSDPKFGDKFEIGKGSDNGLLKVKELLLTVKNKQNSSIIGGLTVPFNIQSFSKSSEVRIKYPLVCHEKQTPVEHGQYGMLDIGLRVFESDEGDEG